MTSSEIRYSESRVSMGRFWFIPLVWWLVWFTAHAFVLVTFGMEVRFAITDSLVYNLMLSVLATGCFFAMRYTRPTAARIGYSLGGLFLVAWLWNWFGSILLLQLEPEMSRVFENNVVLRVTIGWLILVLFMVLGWMFYYARENLYEARKAEEMRRLSSESELQAIRFQIHPHFLFNTLNSISALAGEDVKAAREMISNFSDFLRSNLNKDLRKLVPFEEELVQLERYIFIEKKRFGERLQYKGQIMEHTRNIPVPPLILLPLAENAIKYGLYETVLPTAIITMDTSLENGNLIIRVSNPYEPGARSQNGTGFGLEALSRRMYLLFGMDNLVSTSGKDGIFTVTLVVPVRS